jgi:hypothetical protein
MRIYFERYSRWRVLDLPQSLMRVIENPAILSSLKFDFGAAEIKSSV